MIGTILSIGATAYGAMRASEEADKQQNAIEQNLKEKEARNENFYNKNYYSDATQLADNRRILTEAANRLRRNSQAAAGTTAVMGGTNATAAATKEANNNAYAQMASSAAANAQRYKETTQNQYLRNANSIDDQQREADTAKYNANIKAIQNATGSFNELVSSTDTSDLLDGFKNWRQKRQEAKQSTTQTNTTTNTKV